MTWSVRAAGPADAPAVRELTRAAFAGQDALEPPSGAFRETVEDIAADLAAHGGLVAVGADGTVDAALRFSEHDGAFWLRRVAVRPELRGRGVASLLVEHGLREGPRRGYGEVHIGVRRPLVDNHDYWRRRGFEAVAEHDFWVELARPVALTVEVPTAAEMQALGRRLAALARAGDLYVLSGDLGAGKTTLTQGIGDGLGVRGPVTSPTFVIARVHPTLAAGLPLVHVDAYRLGGLPEVDDLDLEASLDDTLTVVEWGEGKVEGLAEDRLEVVVLRSPAATDETRTVSVRPVGARWVGLDLEAALAPAADR